MRLIQRYTYVVPFVAGLILFGVVLLIPSGSLADLLLNIGASLITIPLVIFTYEKVRERAEREKNKDVAEYVKMNIDREILALLNKVSPLVIKTPTPGLEKVIVLLQQDRTQILKTLETYAPIAYFLATDWGYSEDRISDLLANELIYNNLSIEERNIFIRLIKAIRTLEHATSSRFFMPSGKVDPSYSIVKGDQIDGVAKFKNRYLLMKAVKGSTGLKVSAFNDIKQGKYKVDLLTPMLANADGKVLLSQGVGEILDCIELWFGARGSEFILDNHSFKTIPKRPSVARK